MIGERVYISEKIITSPTDGIFQPYKDTVVSGTLVSQNQTIGLVEGPNSSTEIISPFSGTLTEFTVAAGERVRKHEPIARVNTDTTTVEDTIEE